MATVIGLFFTLNPASAEFPTGQWSNKQEGFNIVTFGLRSDSKGYFSVSMSQMTAPVRWHQEGEKVLIQIAAPPKNLTAIFIPTTDPKVAVLTLPDQEPETFYLIDKKEPPDLEALGRERAKAEVAQISKSFITDTKTVKTMDQLLDEVRSFAKVTEGIGSLNISSDKWPTSIELNRTNTRISVKIILEASRANEPSSTVSYAYTTKEPESDLPKTVYLTLEHRDKIKAWASSEGLNHEFAFYRADGIWGLEGHFAFFAAYIDDDPSKVASVVEHLATSVLLASDGPFAVAETKQK